MLFRSDDEYFNDVIYRYSLRSAIDDKIVKTIDYVQKDDVSSDREYKFQKIRENHESNKRKYPNVKPLSILITKDIRSAKNLYEDFIDFLSEFEKTDREIVERKVLPQPPRRRSWAWSAPSTWGLWMFSGRS